MQRIEYKKGTYFADEGDFASAGAAHFRLADRLASGIASLSMGSFAYRRGLLADALPAAGGTLLYGVELGSNNGPWDVPERVRKANALLRYSRGSADDGYSFTGMAYRNRWNSTDQVPLRAVESGRIGRFGSIDPSDGGESARYSLSYAMRKRGDGALFELDAYLVRSRLDLFSDFTYALANPEQGDQFKQSERRTVAGVNAARAWTAAWGGLAVRNKLGLQARYDRLDPITPRTRLTLDLFNLFDRKASDIDYYYASRLPGEAADGVGDVHFHPVEPRSMRLSLQHGF